MKQKDFIALKKKILELLAKELCLERLFFNSSFVGCKEDEKGTKKLLELEIKWKAACEKGIEIAIVETEKVSNR